MSKYIYLVCGVAALVGIIALIFKKYDVEG